MHIKRWGNSQGCGAVTPSPRNEFFKEKEAWLVSTCWGIFNMIVRKGTSKLLQNAHIF